MNLKASRRLAAIMFTDIVGYTALMQRDEQAAIEIRKRHRAVFTKFHQQYKGEILQYFGDGTLSIFSSGLDAITCAVRIQQALKEDEPVPLRIGLHIGDIVYDGTEIYGDAVNLAARIEGLSVSGAVLISGKLNDELENHPDISTRSLGWFELKNIAHPVEAFSVEAAGLTVPKREELRGNPQTPGNTLAVLPFVNMSSDPDAEYFCDGMTEEIINALAKIKGLKVTSRTSSFYFKNKQISLQKIAEELNVATILEGSIRLAGNKMRITAQLIEVEEDYHFWSETFDRSVEDLFSVQDEVSLLIADKLREHLGHFEIEENLIEAPDVSVEHYKQYLKSRYHILRMTKPDIEMGMAILEGILKENPDFTLGHLGMNLGYTMMATMGFMSPLEGFAKGRPFLDRAIALNPELPECQLHLAYTSFLENWDLPEAYAHTRKSFESRPIVDSYQTMASILVAEGKYDAAFTYIETALQLDPFSEISHHLKGFIHYAREEYSEAVLCFEKSISLKPSFKVPSMYKGQALILMGKAQESLDFFLGLPDEEQGDIIKLGGMTLAHATLGNTSEAEEGLAELAQSLETDFMGRAMYVMILCQMVRGKKEETFAWLERGISHRLPMMVYLFVEPLLKPLRSDSRFETLMHSVLGAGTPLEYAPRKYKQSLLSEDLLVSYRARLEQLMQEEQPYLDPKLSLRDLATQLAIPPNHLSQLLNEGFDKNFSEYVNSYRLEAFKEKVADPSQQHLTLLAMAYDSGFNSKTVFNTFFKKVMGKTPKAYMKELGR